MHYGGGCAASEPFVLRVLGDSMEPEFSDGAMLVIDPGGIPRDGAFVLAEVGGEYIFRQLRSRPGGYCLLALKPGYPQIEDISLNSVRGVVVQRAGTRRRDHKHYD